MAVTSILTMYSALKEKSKYAHPAHRHQTALPAHTRRGLHPGRHAGLRPLRTMRTLLPAKEQGLLTETDTLHVSR